MNTIMDRAVISGIIGAALVLSPGTATAEPAPPGSGVMPVLTHAHAHNDYLNRHPLVDALDHGFSSVEADVWLTGSGGRLMLCHEEKTTATGTRCLDDRGVDDDRDLRLDTTYLRPLQDAITRNGGWVYAQDHRPLQLLVEVKGECSPVPTWHCSTGNTDNADADVYNELRRELAEYPGLRLTTYDVNRSPHVVAGAVQVVLTGAYPKGTVSAGTYQFAASRNVFFDYQSSDCLRDPAQGADYPAVAGVAEVFPLASFKWTDCVGPTGVIVFPSQRARIARAAADKHSLGMKLRFWDTPDYPARGVPDNWLARLLREAAWSAERDYPQRRAVYQVDYLNTNHLTYLRNFLLRHVDS